MRVNQKKWIWLTIAFTLCFLAVGLPYWQIPYNKVSLPTTLMTPALLTVAIAALAVRSFGVAGVWQAAGIVGASVPAVIMARVSVDTMRDPTSHNLWPFEVAIGLFVGFSWALGGALAGSLILKAAARRGGS